MRLPFPRFQNELISLPTLRAYEYYHFLGVLVTAGQGLHRIKITKFEDLEMVQLRSNSVLFIIKPRGTVPDILYL